MKSKVLVVDDSSVDRLLAAGLLESRKGIQVDFAINGAKAMATLDRATTKMPDLVLTDMIMPRMDGLELVKAVRKKFPQVPVILMTAYGNEAIAKEALRLGAVSYVPKAKLNELLLLTVEQVLARTKVEKEPHRLFESAHSINCTFMLEGNPSRVRPVIDLVQQAMSGTRLTDATGRIRVAIALEEALLNAIYHGGPKTDRAYMQRLATGPADSDQENVGRAKSNLHKIETVEMRRNVNRKIAFDIRISNSEATFVIRDRGDGFDPVLAAGVDNASRFERGRSRGLTLIRSLADECRYNDIGNELTLTKRRELKFTSTCQ